MRMLRNLASWLKRLRQKASGEMIGFAVCIPMLMLVFAASVSVAEIGLTEEMLEYAAYSGTRAACISVDYDTAQQRLQTVVEEILRRNGETSTPTCTITMLDPDGVTGYGWLKGAFIRCDVSIYKNTLLPIFSGQRKASMVMMIERQALD